EPPSEGLPVNEVYGNVLKGLQPNFAYYSAKGWWPALLGQEKSVTLDLGILGTHATNRLPTRDEATHLLAQHESTRRALDTEELMQAFEGQLGSGIPWEKDASRAREALALSAMTSGFATLRCEAPSPHAQTS